MVCSSSTFISVPSITDDVQTLAKDGSAYYIPPRVALLILTYTPVKQNAYQEAHTKAAKSHQDAADTHAKAQRANVAAAATMTKQGKTPAAEKHTANAGVHEQQEQTHMAAAANHLENAKTHHSLGPSAEDAMKSSAKAQMSQSQASTSARNANNVANAKPKRKTLI